MRYRVPSWNALDPEGRRLLTIDQAAERLNVNRRYVRHLLARRRIARVKIGNLVRIPEESVEELIAVGYRPAVKKEEKVDG